MAHARAWSGVAWRGMPYHAIPVPSPSSSQSKIRDRPKQTVSSFPSPHLVSSRLGSFGNPGFPWGFPIASPKHPPISGKSHKHPSPSPSHASLPPTRPLFFLDNLLSLAATHSSWGYPPALAKLQVTSLPHTFHLRALHLEFACFSLWTRQPPLTPVLHPDPPPRDRSFVPSPVP
jgi:hypothetical protein